MPHEGKFRLKYKACLGGKTYIFQSSGGTIARLGWGGGGKRKLAGWLAGWQAGRLAGRLDGDQTNDQNDQNELKYEKHGTVSKNN